MEKGDCEQEEANIETLRDYYTLQTMVKGKDKCVKTNNKRDNGETSRSPPMDSQLVV